MMNHWGLIRRSVAAAHKRESLRKPRGFRLALAFAQEQLEQDPNATAADIERAAVREGMDPTTLYILALILGTVIELWIKWRNK